MEISFGEDVPIDGLEKLLINGGQYMPVPARTLNAFSSNQLRVFAHDHALYQFPTTELVEWLDEFIGDLPAIEIGSGNGCIGRALGIPMTDNRMQEWGHIISYYNMLMQPVITYGADVECLNAIEAIAKYNPTVVIACWVTQLKTPFNSEGNAWGIDEAKLLELVDHYIVVGNTNIHGRKDIYLNVPDTHILKEYQFDWLVTRQSEQNKNTIYVWSRKEG